LGGKTEGYEDIVGEISEEDREISSDKIMEDDSSENEGKIGESPKSPESCFILKLSDQQLNIDNSKKDGRRNGKIVLGVKNKVVARY